MPTPQEQLDDLKDQYEACAASAEGIFRSSAEDVLLARPGVMRWSAAECIVHLNLTADAFLDRVQPLLADLRDKDERAARPYRMTLFAKLLNYTLDPPVHLKFPTSAPFRPQECARAADVFSRFARYQNEFLGVIHSAAGLAIDRRKIVSPFAKQVRYNLYDTLVIAASHQRRHLWQARQAIHAVRNAGAVRAI